MCAKLWTMGVRIQFFALPGGGAIEAAHVGDHGKGEKCSDLETLPLCRWHHQVAPDAHHVLGPKFWAHHGLNRGALIEQHQQDFYVRAA